MTESFEQAEKRAMKLGNRGPLLVDEDGKVDPKILDAYWEHGFYILTSVLSDQEMGELRNEFHVLLKRTPASSSANVDCDGEALDFDDTQRRLFRFVKPLTDPYGGTEFTNSRYQVKMPEPDAPKDAPDEVLLQIGGILQFLDPTVRIYGHPKLLALAEAINGPDFTPFNDVIWLKQPRLGAAVSWHQDGTTHWESPSLDPGTHGFNYMVNIYETRPENALWVVPGTHTDGKADLKRMIQESDSDRPNGAVPLLCEPGDIALCNRQIVHGSFPNTSDVPRYTFVFGFHRRSSILGVKGWAKEPYTENYINASSRIIPLAIDARKQRQPDEQSYEYQPLAHEKIEFNETSREQILTNYQRRAIGI